jgi:hypothetical protein
MTDIKIEYSGNHKFEYEVFPNGFESVIKVDDFDISGDKCAYECKHCGAIYQSKNINVRSIFPTHDPRSGNQCSNQEGHDLIRICKCEPIIK